MGRATGGGIQTEKQQEPMQQNIEQTSKHKQTTLNHKQTSK